MFWFVGCESVTEMFLISCNILCYCIAFQLQSSKESFHWQKQWKHIAFSIGFAFFFLSFIGLKCLFKYKFKWQESRSLKVIREIWIYAANEICLLTIYQDMQNIEENSAISIFNISWSFDFFFCKCSIC